VWYNTRVSENPVKTSPITPPRLIPSLVAGFNLVASNIYLILLPIIVDLFLWMGPHYRLKTLLSPWVNSTFELLSSNSTPDMNRLTESLAEIWQILLDRFNLASSLVTFPVGVPSIVISLSPLSTPIGIAPVIEVGSLSHSILLWVVFSVLGLAFGALYFASIARSAAGGSIQFNLRDLAWQTWQTTLLTVVLFVVAFLMLIPLSIVVSVFALINPLLAQIVLLILSFLGMWLIIPMVFCPHGIFMYRMGILASLMASVRLVRLALPTTGIFLLAVVVINQGMNVIWRIPPETSWMTLIGIFGNAFITTGLLSASFVFYRTGAEWLQEILRHSTTLGAKT
jgi:hypothetical protein